MTAQSIVRRFLLGAATFIVLAVAGIAVPAVVGVTPAYAQVSAEFQAALDQYGEWRRDARYGDIWVPTGLPRDWRPYENGHWVYTDDWGWYWVSDDTEDDFGWVVYHYGRWAFDPGTGWFWVPGDEWAPAWVDWRYGDDIVGWAPLPPDGVDVDAYEAEPAYWVFVPDRYITAPRLRSYYVPQARRAFFIRSTHIVNRTLGTRGAHIAVNPGISPAFVARVTHASLPTYRVRPRVFASTQGVSGAVQVRPEDLRKRPGSPGGAPRVNAVSVQRTNNVIKVDAAVTAPKPLGKGESGQLGSHPPRAAQGGVTPQQQPAAPVSPPPAGATTRTPPRAGPVPAVAPMAQPAKPEERQEERQEERHEERRDVHPPANTPPPPLQTAPKQPAVVQPAPHPAPPPPPPPAMHAPPPPPPVHAPAPPPPPAVHAPPPPPPPVVHAPPPPPPAARQAAPPPTPAEKPAEAPK